MFPNKFRTAYFQQTIWNNMPNKFCTVQSQHKPILAQNQEQSRNDAKQGPGFTSSRRDRSWAGVCCSLVPLTRCTILVKIKLKNQGYIYWKLELPIFPKVKLNRTLKPHLKSTLLTHHSPARECMKILDEQRSTGTEIESGFCFFLSQTLLYFVCFILHIHDTHSTAYACMKVQPSRATKDQRGQHMCPSIS